VYRLASETTRRSGLHQVVLGRPAVFGDPAKVAALAGTQHPRACGDLLLDEQAGLDLLGGAARGGHVLAVFAGGVDVAADVEPGLCEG
jgi:hypothetical protein